MGNFLPIFLTYLYFTGTGAFTWLPPGGVSIGVHKKLQINQMTLKIKAGGHFSLFIHVYNFFQ